MSQFEDIFVICLWTNIDMRMTVTARQHMSEFWNIFVYLFMENIDLKMTAFEADHVGVY